MVPMSNTIDGYLVSCNHSGTTEGFSGIYAMSPAMSKEVAEEYIRKFISPNAGAILKIISGARFIELPGGKIHDNRSGITYESYANYAKQPFLQRLG